MDNVLVCFLVVLVQTYLLRLGFILIPGTFFPCLQRLFCFSIGIYLGVDFVFIIDWCSICAEL